MLVLKEQRSKAELPEPGVWTGSVGGGRLSITGKRQKSRQDLELCGKEALHLCDISECLSWGN